MQEHPEDTRDWELLSDHRGVSWNIDGRHEAGEKVTEVQFSDIPRIPTFEPREETVIFRTRSRLVTTEYLEGIEYTDRSSKCRATRIGIENHTTHSETCRSRSQGELVKDNSVAWEIQTR